MHLVNPFILARKNPNLFIGGISSVIYTKAQLAFVLNVSETNLKYFKIIGSDIEAEVQADCKLAGSAFTNTDITYFKSYGNKVSELGALCFKNCLSLTEVDIESDGLLLYNKEHFENCSNLSPSNLKLPKIFPGTRFANTFSGIKNDGTTLDLSKTLEINFTSSVSNNALDGLSTVSVDLRNCTKINLTFSSFRGFFKGVDANIKLWSLTSLQSDPSAVTYIFGNTSMSKTIEVNVAMKTANSGSPHAELVDAISKGATVIYTDSSGNVIP